MGSAQGADAPIEGSSIFVNGAAVVARRHYDHSHASEYIFDAVIELGHEHFFACLRTFSLGDIPRDFRCTYNLALCILDRRDRERNFPTGKMPIALMTAPGHDRQNSE
jgi:hypothetical protein